MSSAWSLGGGGSGGGIAADDAVVWTATQEFQATTALRIRQSSDGTPVKLLEYIPALEDTVEGSISGVPEPTMQKWNMWAGGNDGDAGSLHRGNRTFMIGYNMNPDGVREDNADVCMGDRWETYWNPTSTHRWLERHIVCTARDDVQYRAMSILFQFTSGIACDYAPTIYIGYLADTVQISKPGSQHLAFTFLINNTYSALRFEHTEYQQTNQFFQIQRPTLVWTATTSFAQGQFVRPTNYNGLIYEKTNSGSHNTGSSEPSSLFGNAWPTSIGGTITDGGITWTCRAITYSNLVGNYNYVSIGRKYSILTLGNDGSLTNSFKTTTVQLYVNNTNRFTIETNGDPDGTPSSYDTTIGNTDISDHILIGSKTSDTIGFYGTFPIARQTRAGQLTDNTAGTANTTLEALTSGTVYATDVAAIRNNFADLAARYNALETIVHNLGLTT